MEGQTASWVRTVISQNRTATKQNKTKQTLGKTKEEENMNDTKFNDLMPFLVRKLLPLLLLLLPFWDQHLEVQEC